MKKTISIISITSILVIVACSIALCFVGCQSTKQANEPIAVDDVLSIKQTSEINSVVLEVSKPLYFAGGDTGTSYIQQTVYAVITPSTVVDKYVTWSVAWASNAALSSKNVSDYIQIIQDGSTTCNLRCFKSFRGSNIILTCTTRQNNKSATATITFNGIPSAMTLGNANGTSTYNLGSMTVPSLYVGSTYNVPINLTNIFGDVGTSYNNFIVTVSGVGSLTCGTYTQSPRGAGWSSTDDHVELNDVVNDLVSCTTSGSTLQITVNKSISGYYGSMETKYVEGNGQTTIWRDKIREMNTDNDGNKPYIVITVKHANYNFSATYKCFLEEQVSSISISGSTIVF